jgi:hypothetical protein
MALQLYHLRNILFAIFLCLLSSSIVHGQWGNNYANSWINYDQDYYKLAITKEGLYRIPLESLPSSIKNGDIEKIQIFRAGKEVSVISADSTGILFYGRPNTGETDSLLYRPLSSRLNTYSSLFSKTASYYITLGKVNGKRAQNVGRVSGVTSKLESKHRGELLSLYESEYSLSTLIAIYPKFMNSFYEKGASRTGARHLGDTLVVTSFSINNMQRSDQSNPILNLLFHGRSYFSRTVEVFVGRSAGSLRKIGEVRIEDFEPKMFSSELSYTDFDDSGKIYVGYKSSQKDRLERFSLTYAQFLFDQKLVMGGLKSQYFSFPKIGTSNLHFGISGATSNHKAYEISNKDNPLIVGNDLNDVAISNTLGKNLKFYVTADESVISLEQVKNVKFEKFDPKRYNYIILTNDELKAAANEYANYRKSVVGGNYNTLVVSIKDVYNQFNYGEVSPIAIKRFVDYMVSDKNKNKYLLLLGTSITFVERMRPELEGDIPTVGYPGSDVLLVSGLMGEKEDVPVIPVGRVSASTSDQVLTYLNKVKAYESIPDSEVGWKKNVLHINGGKTIAEINSFSAELEKLAPLVTNSALGGNVKSYVKQSLIEVEKVDISSDVNNGVGLITYVGHGSQTVTDLDFGYASQEINGYRNFRKYPLMYFNGCGVGNMFNNRLNPNLNASDKMPLALDWLLAKDRGAVSIIANSFDSYLGPSVKYLEMLYDALFVDRNSDTLSIGKIQINVINKVLTQPGLSSYDIANVHQSILNGDPAIHLFSIQKPDYTFDESQGMSLHATNNRSIGSSDSILLKIPLKNLGRFKAEEQIDIYLTITYRDGQTIALPRVKGGWAGTDSLSVNFKNNGRSITRIDAQIDKDDYLDELNKLNNKTALYVDWDAAESLLSYFNYSNVDIISPILDISFNGRLIESQSEVSPRPYVSIRVTDDRYIDYKAGEVTFFYKKCVDESCSYKEVAASDFKDISVKRIIDGQYLISFTADFLNEEGSYSILLRAKDLAGNTSNPYLTVISIKDKSEEAATLIVSPNPASNYVKFTGNFGHKTYDNASISIFDIKGVRVYKKDIKFISSEFFEESWIPKELSGVYFYAVEFFKEHLIGDRFNGRLVLVR